jgi:mannose-6-phosphate isomerase-like protein (cupin superfamily)
MSYPPPLYDGDTGEVSAAFRPVSQVGELPHAHYLATGASTHGQFGLYRWLMAPHAGGPDAHFHRSISESFDVLAGSVRLFDGSTWTDTEPGDFLYVPEGGIHAFRNDSDEPASMLLLFAPGAPREEYFETLADAARREAMDEQERAAFMLRHDTFWV